jgi:glutamine synthetase
MTLTESALPARRLETILGKPPGTWTVDDMVRLVRERGIRIVSLMHVGLDGWLKTLDFAPLGDGHLRDVLEGGERADGSSLFAGSGIRPGASDVLLRPRIATAFLDPFARDPGLVVLCGHEGRDGAPLPESPDTILRQAHARLRDATGVDLCALGEVEYFLGKRRTDGDIYGADERGYHASSPFVFGETSRRRALALLAEIGVPVKYGHSEVGYIAANDQDEVIWEQHEIEMALTPLPEAAEGVVLAQWVLRNLAHEAGMQCSFDPIMRKGHAGSGLHVHLAPERNGRTAGRVGPADLDDVGRWVVAGLVRLAPALMAFGNRSVGSFVRLSQAREAPSSVTWGAFDRSALIRLPAIARTVDGRPTTPPTIEFRLPDGSAQPYLLLAGIAQAVHAEHLRGDAGGVLEAAAGGCGTPLPRTFREIADALDAGRGALEAGGVFPGNLLDHVTRSLRG